MSRKSNVIEADAQIIADGILTAAAEPHAIMKARAQEVAELKPLFDYLGTDEYDEKQCISQLKGHLLQVGASCFESGILLTILKAKMPWGEFTKFCETELPIGRAQAYALIQFVCHVRQLADQSGGKLDIKKLRSLERRKVAALVFLSESAPEETKDGKIAGKTLDEIAITPRHELEAEVRDKKRQLSAAVNTTAKLREDKAKLLEQIHDFRTPSKTSIPTACDRLRAALQAAYLEFRNAAKPDEDKITELDTSTLQQVRDFTHDFAAAIDADITERYPSTERPRRGAVKANGSLSGLFNFTTPQAEPGDTDSEDYDLGVEVPTNGKKSRASIKSIKSNGNKK